MAKVNKSTCVLNALLCVSTYMSSAAAGQVGLSKEKTAVLTECAKKTIGNATVCWVKFSDGTRCVIATDPALSKNNSGTSTAINCEFTQQP